MTRYSVFTIALGMIVSSAAHASVVDYYATGAFTSVTGESISTTTDPIGCACGGPFANNTATFGSGVQLTFFTFGNASSPSSTNVPSALDYGLFIVNNNGTVGAFTFSLVVHDVTDGGTSSFTGTSSGGTVAAGSPPVTITWAAGPNSTPLFWRVFTTALIPPDPGSSASTPIEGDVTATPEPSSWLLMTGSLGPCFPAIRRSRVLI